MRRAARDLHEAGARFALVGGFAVSARAMPRTTRDVDLVVWVADDAEAEELIFTLRALAYDVLASVEQRATKRLATVRLRAPRSTVVVDLLFASSGIEDEIARDAEVLEIVRGVRLPVASLPHLIALKVLARDDLARPQDAQDLRALLAEATEQDVERARAALALITARGAARNRDLHEGLERAQRELGPR